MLSWIVGFAALVYICSQPISLMRIAEGVVVVLIIFCLLIAFSVSP